MTDALERHARGLAVAMAEALEQAMRRDPVFRRELRRHAEGVLRELDMLDLELEQPEKM